MGDRSKFEQMLEYLINDEENKARDLFHDIVVAKSREIYENLLAEDFEEEETDEGRDEDDEDVEENMGMMPPPEEEGMMGVQDATDDMMNDVEASDDDMADMDGDMDDMDMGNDSEEEIGDRLDDLESELEALRDEFESLMGDEGGEEDDDMDSMDGEDDISDEEDDDEMKDAMAFEKRGDDDDDDEEQTDEDFIREYVEKVGGGNYNTWGKMGDDGANTKSIIDNMKNDMGGTTANILNGGEYKGKEVGAGSTIEGNGVFKQTKPQLQDGGNINVPGGKAGKTAFKKREPGHGPEKKGPAEGQGLGSGSGGPQGQVGSINTKSPISGAPKRAK
jgi:hypothetical protein